MSSSTYFERYKGFRTNLLTMLKEIFQTSASRNFFKGVLISGAIALLFILYAMPSANTLDFKAVRGEYSIDNRSSNFEIVCGTVSEDDVPSSDDKYLFKCREELPEVTKYRENFKSLAVIYLERSNGDVVDSEKIINPSALGNGSYVGKQSFLLRSPDYGGRYRLVVEEDLKNSTTTNRSFDIKLGDQAQTSAFRVYSPSEERTIQYRRTIVLLESFILASIGIAIAGRIIEFNRIEE